MRGLDPYPGVAILGLLQCPWESARARYPNCQKDVNSAGEEAGGAGGEPRSDHRHAPR
jgi:hypothetical protein